MKDGLGTEHGMRARRPGARMKTKMKMILKLGMKKGPDEISR